MAIKKDSEIHLDPAVADQMLSNIFDVCDYEGNTVPLTVLSSYKNYRKERNYLQRGIVTVILCLLLLMPILFVTPDVSVEHMGTYQDRPAIWVGYHSLLPVKDVCAFSGEHRIPVQETQKGSFLIFPDRNGELSVEITLINGQTGRASIAVTDADLTPPKLLRSELKQDKLTIYFYDDSGKLNYEACHGKTLQGKTIWPLSYDEENMSVTFRYSLETLNIFVEDLQGNVLQMVYDTQAG